jgi:glycosyltransferase involved in cell wall biosynthesis
MLRRADAIITVTPGLAELLVARGADPERIAVVPNTVPTERVAAAPAEQPAGGDVTFVWIGHLMAWHVEAVDRLIAVAPRVLEAAPAARFLIVGDGPGGAALRARAAAAGLAERLTFTGSIPGQDVPALLGSCQVGIIPSVFDYAFPVKLAEMGAAGLPVATPRSASLDRLIAPGVEYLDFRPDDPDALADALVSLALDRDLRLRLGQALHDAVRTRFTWQESAEATQAVVARALEQAAAARL